MKAGRFTRSDKFSEVRTGSDAITKAASTLPGQARCLQRAVSVFLLTPRS